MTWTEMGMGWRVRGNRRTQEERQIEDEAVIGEIDPALITRTSGTRGRSMKLGVGLLAGIVLGVGLFLVVTMFSRTSDSQPFDVQLLLTDRVVFDFDQQRDYDVLSELEVGDCGSGRYPSGFPTQWTLTTGNDVLLLRDGKIVSNTRLGPGKIMRLMVNRNRVEFDCEFSIVLYLPSDGDFFVVRAGGEDRIFSHSELETVPPAEALRYLSFDLDPDLK